MMKKLTNRSKLQPLIMIVVLALILCLGILWTIWATQEAVKISESTLEIAEDQTKQKSDQDAPATTPDPTPENPTEATETATTAYPITLTDTEASSLAVVVNKKHKLPADYTPALVSVRGGQVRQEVSTSLESLFTAAELAGLSPKIISSYRSYARQEQVYNGYVAENGQAVADTFSARPGHSEHQTGLAVDVGNLDGNCDLEVCFGNTPLGQWIAANSHLYGFIVRYPDGKQDQTGYQYEPWHLRYIGSNEIAGAIYNSGQTLDQYFNISAGGYN